MGSQYDPRPICLSRVIKCGAFAKSKHASQLKVDGVSLGVPPRDRMLGGSVLSASKSLWGISWVWVGWGCAYLEPEQRPKGGRAARSKFLRESGLPKTGHVGLWTGFWLC